VKRRQRHRKILNPNDALAGQIRMVACSQFAWFGSRVDFR
jgi:hypothetical protein